MIRVKLVYRNYKPLHSAYMSLLTDPPEKVEFIAPTVNERARGLYKYYRKVRFFSIAKPLIRLAEKTLFLKKSEHDEADLYQYLNLISPNSPRRPYIVDTEHAAGMISFTPDERRIKQVKKFLTSPDCKAVTCWSHAAEGTLKGILGKDYQLIADKVHVVYPAVKPGTGLKPDYSVMSRDPGKLKLLLVGNQSYLKGTQELLEAVKKLNRQYGEDKLELHIISNDAAEVVEEYSLPNVKHYPPTYNKKEIMQKFYLPADLFIMPTKQETFGMAFLDALACGTAVVTTNQFATPEIVTDGKDGILLHLDNAVMDSSLVPDKAAMDSVTKPNMNPRLANEIVRVLRRFLDGELSAAKLGNAGKKKFKPEGRFSIATRNKQILQIYIEALK